MRERRRETVREREKKEAVRDSDESQRWRVGGRSTERGTKMGGETKERDGEREGRESYSLKIVRLLFVTRCRSADSSSLASIRQLFVVANRSPETVP